MGKKILLFGIIFFLLSTFSYAIEPSQTYNKIFANPFYRASMTNNQNFTYSFKINPPDNVAGVVSAIANLQVFLTPTVTFNAWINGTPCNTASYTVSTTFAGSGQALITFDCSNVITKAGNYQATIRPSGANTGASTMWFDITYINNASDFISEVGTVNSVESVRKVGKGTMEIHGTEYFENDDGTLFVQLKDNDGIPIENATCAVTIFYPNIALSVHPVWIMEAQMQRLQHNGIYFYDLITPAISRLYMANVHCTFATNHSLFYDGTTPDSPIRNITAGTYTGDSFLLNTYTDWLYTQCDSTTAVNKQCDAFYNFTIGNNISQIFVNYLGESESAPTLTFYWYNWLNSSWVSLPNTLTFHGTASTDVPSGVDEYASNKIPNLTKAIKMPENRVSIRLLSTSGSTFHQFDNWLTLDTTQTITSIEELKGSGEIHVSSFVPDSLTARFYKILTCNGDSSGKCGIFTNDGEFDLLEGEIEDYFNISAVSTRNDVSLFYESPFTVDCTALYWIKQWNGTDWNDFTDYSQNSNPNLENCQIEFNLDITSGNEYDFWLKFDNYMTWETAFSEQIARAINKSIFNFCNGQNTTYEVPITEITVISNDTIEAFCHYSMDDFYWIYYFLDLGSSITTAGDYASIVAEARFYRKELYDRYMFLSLYSDGQIQLGDVPSSVWQYNIRELTNIGFSVNASVNSSGIAESVWGFTNKTISDITNQNIVFIGGTEYNPADDGKVALRLIRGSGTGANVETGAVCNLNILYPNQTYFISNTSITEFGDGIYYYDFTVPDYLGVYTYSSDCINGGRKYFALDTFHVFEPFSNVNNTAIAEGVWGYTGSITTNILSQIADKIWEFVGGIKAIIS